MFKEEQQDVKQLTLIENSSKFIAISRPKNPTGVENMKTTATLYVRAIPGMFAINKKVRYLLLLCSDNY